MKKIITILLLFLAVSTFSQPWNTGQTKPVGATSLQTPNNATWYIYKTDTILGVQMGSFGYYSIPNINYFKRFELHSDTVRLKGYFTNYKALSKVNNVTGSLPIVVSSGMSPNVSINPASCSQDGYMLSTDKCFIDSLKLKRGELDGTKPILKTENGDSITVGVPFEYGALYNWYAATDVRGIAPVGFHVPTESEWGILITYLGGESIAGGKLKEIGFDYWDYPNTGATNEVGFNAKGSSYRTGDTGEMTTLKQNAYFFQSDDYDTYYFRCKYLNRVNSSILQDYRLKSDGQALRFIADSGTPTTAIGNDGKVYPCVTIGTQTWTVANSNETKYRNGDYIHGFDGGVYTPISNSDWAALTSEGMCYYNDVVDHGGTVTKTPVIKNVMLGDTIKLPNISGLATKVALADTASSLRTKINTKVTKITGKALSSNDFTDADSLKLKSVIPHDSLTIAAGSINYFAVNHPQIFSGTGIIDTINNVKGRIVPQLQSDWTQSTTTAKDYIKNKPTLGTAAKKDTTFFIKASPVAAQSANIWLNGNITLPDSLATGVVYKRSTILGNQRFLHDYAPSGSDGHNTFLGVGAGNFTMSLGANPSNFCSTNTGIGYLSLTANTTGKDNTGIGKGTLAYNTTGNWNTAVGTDALQQNTTGVNNTGIGVDALLLNTSGQKNVAVGENSLVANTTGVENTGVGMGSLYSMVSGTGNTGIGYAALGYLPSGFQNTAIGYTAGSSLTSNNLNTFIGNAAGFNALQKVDAANSTAIGNGAYTTASDQIVIGNSSVTENLFSGHAIFTDYIQSTTGKFTNLSDGYIPYHVSDASGLSNSSIWTDGTKVGIGTITPTNILSFNNSQAQKIWIENSATDVVGRNLSISAGSTILGTSVSNVNGGNLILQSGQGTGTGSSSILFNTSPPQASGTTIQTSTTKMTLLGSGNFGIGNTTPAAKLDVLQLLTGTDAVLSSLEIGTLNYTASPSGTGSAYILNFSGTGLGSTNINQFNGIVTNIFNQTSAVLTTQQAYTAGVRVVSSGNTTNAYCYQATPTLSSTGSITTAYKGFYAVAPSISGAGTIASAYGMYAANQGNANVTNAYGLYIENQTGSPTYNYSIYSVGGTNYFGGNVGIGIVPTSYLHLKAGSATAGTGQIKLNVGTAQTVAEAGGVNHVGTTTNSHFEVTPYISSTATVKTLAYTTDIPIATSGTYTPTATNVTNITSSTPKITSYTRVGNIVTAFGTITITNTLAVASEVDVTLPIASNLAAATDLNGTGTMNSTASVNLYINGDATNDRARIYFTSAGVGQTSTIYFTFQYSVL